MAGPSLGAEQYVGKVMKHRRNDAFWQPDERADARWLDADDRDLSQTGCRPIHGRPVAVAMTSERDRYQRDICQGRSHGALLEARDQKIVRYLGITGHYRPTR